METVRWLLGFLALSYIGLPLLILFSQKAQADPQFLPIDSSSVPPDVSRFFSSVVPELEKEGFYVSVSLGLPSLMPDMQTFLVMLINRSTGDRAMVTVINSTNPKALSTVMYLEFSTRFVTGECFDTLNAPTLSAFQNGPKNTKTRVPSVQDPHTLYQIHRWVMNQKAPAASKITCRDGEEGDHLKSVLIESYNERVLDFRWQDSSSWQDAYYRTMIIESYDEQVRFGRLKLNAGEAVYQPTIKGAYLMTWGMLWPLSWIRKAMMKSEEQATLRAFRATQGTTLTSF
jgi:hypothetical protein